jgi:hypothetical protein
MDCHTQTIFSLSSLEEKLPIRIVLKKKKTAKMKAPGHDRPRGLAALRVIDRGHCGEQSKYQTSFMQSDWIRLSSVSAVAKDAREAHTMLRRPRRQKCSS